MGERPTVSAGLYALVVAGALIYTALTFVWFSLPAYLTVIVADVGLSGTEAGILAGAVPLTYVPLGIATGVVVDRVGPVRSLAGGLVVFGLAQVGRSVAHGFPTLLATTVLIGVGATTVTFGLPKLVGVCFPAERAGTPTSIYLVGGTAGTALVFAVGRPILGPALGGWRALFLWSGLAAVGYAVVWLLAARLTLGASEPATDRDGTLDLASVRSDLGTLLTHRDLRLLVVVATMYLLVVHGVQGWLPTILQARGLGEGLAGQLTSVFVIATVLAVVVVPQLADRYDARREAVVGAGLLGFAGLFGIVAGGTTPVAIAGIALAGFGAGGLSPLVRSIPPNLEGVGAGLTGTAMGLTFAIGEIGGFVGPVAIGTLFDLTGTYVAGLSVLLAGTLVVAGAGIAMRDI